MMTRHDRDELARLIRRREKLAKGATAQRAAELMADFEQQLAKRYSFDDDYVWREAHAAAEEAVAKAAAEVEKRCEQLGIPESFRPGISGVGWYGRGENAVAERRTELRRVAKSRVDALTAAAKVEIERRSVDVQTTLIAGGLESDEARAFLESMPTPEGLMPVLALTEIEAQAGTGIVRRPRR
jgi:hypothetical protein